MSERDRQTDRQTDRHRQRHRHSQTETQTDTERECYSLMGATCTPVSTDTAVSAAEEAKTVNRGECCLYNE